MRLGNEQLTSVAIPGAIGCFLAIPQLLRLPGFQVGFAPSLGAEVEDRLERLAGLTGHAATCA